MLRPDFSERAYDVLDVLEVHDGDTFALLLDAGFRQYAGPWLRLKDYSAPELRRRGGAEARAATQALLHEHLGTLFVVTTKVSPNMAAKLAQQFGDSPRSFARYVADVWLDSDMRLGDELVARGHARRGAFVG